MVHVIARQVTIEIKQITVTLVKIMDTIVALMDAEVILITHRRIICRVIVAKAVLMVGQVITLLVGI